MKNFAVILLAVFLAAHMHVLTAWSLQSETVEPSSSETSASAMDKPENQPSGENHVFEQSFNETIEQWISTLAKESKFNDWETSTWEKFPLGPGTHGWIVHIYHEHKEVGYLVVHSSPTGELQLSEYGAGDNPLFSLSRLNQILIQHELIPKADHIEKIYIGPFHAIWKISGKDFTYFFDAVTGEAYPLIAKNIANIEQSESQSVSTLTPDPFKLKASLRLPWFDPYENINWVQDIPLSLSTQVDLIQELELPQHPITYTTSIFNDIILVPLAVTGYDLWEDDKLFVSLDHNGMRFIPFSILQQEGHFYSRGEEEPQ